MREKKKNRYGDLTQRRETTRSMHLGCNEKNSIRKKTFKRNARIDRGQKKLRGGQELESAAKGFFVKDWGGWGTAPKTYSRRAKRKMGEKSRGSSWGQVN